jgi:uncharacterized membrane-anchored protein YhcB (DUF1043 family)
VDDEMKLGKFAILGILSSIGGMTIAQAQLQASAHTDEEREEVKRMEASLADSVRRAAKLFTISERVSKEFREDYAAIRAEMAERAMSMVEEMTERLGEEAVKELEERFDAETAPEEPSRESLLKRKPKLDN